MEQGHILEGLLSGDKPEKASLAEQIASIDFQLFKHAMHSVSKQVDRYELWIPVIPCLAIVFSKEADLFIIMFTKYLLYIHVYSSRMLLICNNIGLFVILVNQNAFVVCPEFLI